MAAIIGIVGSIAGSIGSVASVAGPILGAVGAGEALFGGGSSTPNSGGSPYTATGGQSANILPNGQLAQAGGQYLTDAMGLQGYGQGYASQFFPQVANATQAAAYNPYGGQAIGGAQGAANYGAGSLAPYQDYAAGQLGGLAGQYSPYASQALSQAFQPSAGNQYLNQYLQQAATPTSGSGYTGQALGQAFSPGAGAQYTGQALAQAFGGNNIPQQYLQQALSQATGGQNIPQTYLDQSLQRAYGTVPGTEYAQQALATGFAPNNGLYNQKLQQTADQSNAINSMYGLSQSPYGAHLTDQNVQEFNNAFDMNQAQLQGQAANTYSNIMNENLAYQNQGLQSYGQLSSLNLANQQQGLSGLGQIGNYNLSQQGQGLAGFNSLQNQQLAQQGQGLSAYTGLMNTGLANQTGNLNAYNSLSATGLNNQLGLGGLGSSLGSSAAGLYGQGSTLGQGAYGTLGAAGGLPAAAYQGLATNSLNAFGTGAQNANATLNPYTTYLNSLGSILGLGQVGQQNAAQQAQVGFGQQQQIGGNLGQSLAMLGGGGQGGGSGGGVGGFQQIWNTMNGYNPYAYNPGQTVTPGSIDLSGLSNLDLPNIFDFQL